MNSSSITTRQLIVLIASLILVFCLLIVSLVQNKVSSELAWKALLLIMIALTPMLLHAYGWKYMQWVIFPLNCLFYAIAIGFSAFRDVNDLRFLGLDYYRVMAVEYTVYGLLSQIVAYIVANLCFNKIRPIYIFNMISTSNYRLLGWVFVTIRMALYLFPGLGDIPSLAQFVIMAGMLGTAIIYCLFLTKQLPFYQSAIFFGVFIPVEIFYRTISGLLANTMIYVLMLIIVRWQIQKKVSWYFIIAIVFIFYVVSPIKNEYRTVTWNSTDDRSPVQKFTVMMDLVEQYWMYDRKSDTFEEVGNSTDRFNQINLFSAVISKTPGIIPYWDGETYSGALYIFIPRIVWPDKPAQTLGNTFGHRYSILDDTDVTTSLNLPWIVEFYANFSVVGVVFGMALVGVLFSLFENLFYKSISNIREKLFSVVITMPLVYPESNLVISWGSLLMAIFSVYFITLLLHNSK